MKNYRENITPQQAEARRQALVQLLRTAGQTIDAGGSRESLDRLNVALIGMGHAYGTEQRTGKQPVELVNPNHQGVVK